MRRAAYFVVLSIIAAAAVEASAHWAACAAVGIAICLGEMLGRAAERHRLEAFQRWRDELDSLVKSFDAGAGRR